MGFGVMAPRVSSVRLTAVFDQGDQSLELFLPNLLFEFLGVVLQVDDGDITVGSGLNFFGDDRGPIGPRPA